MPPCTFSWALPASGKTTAAAAAFGDAVWRSSDAIRAELGKDGQTSQDNTVVFNTLHTRIFQDLKAGRSAVYDATNLNRKRRISFLKTIQHLPCRKICILFLADIDECKRRNSLREQPVPDEVYDRFLKGFQPPALFEGWDEIWVRTSGEFQPFDMLQTVGYDQKNPHHQETLYEHLDAAYQYVVRKDPENYRLRMAALHHDIGKVYTQTPYNAHGLDDGSMHYYGHENYGSYLYLTHMAALGRTDWENILYEAVLISLHMRPLTAWKNAPVRKERDAMLFGKMLFQDLCLLMEADKAASVAG